MVSCPSSSLLKNEENAPYKSCLTANRKCCATENVWGNALPQLGSRSSYVRDSRVNPLTAKAIFI